MDDTPFIINNNSNISLEKQLVICHKCQETGHYAGRCRNVWSLKDKSKMKRTSNKTNNCNDTDPNKLAKSGDVESNPGPTRMNNDAKSSGRPKKKAFPTKSSKVAIDSIANQSSIDNTSSTPSAMLTRRNNPIGLINSGENICFLNCVVQILYFIPALHTRLHEYISQTLITPLTYDQHVRDNVMTALKSLFDDISNAYSEVRSSRYFHKLKRYSNWRLGQQQDSHEFLDHILNNLYPTLEDDKLEDDCIFKIDLMTYIECNQCSEEIPKSEQSLFISIEVQPMVHQSVGGLINNYMHREEIEYRCEKQGCNGTNASKTLRLTGFSDILVIQLKIFSFDDHMQSRKLKPSINLDDQISYYGIAMNLFGVIYHGGNRANSGHYTSALKVHGKWFLTNDSQISRNVVLSCSPSDYNTPYILFYKRLERISMDSNSSNTSTSCTPGTQYDTTSEKQCSLPHVPNIDFSLETVNDDTIDHDILNLNVNNQYQTIVNKSFDNLCQAIRNDDNKESTNQLQSSKDAVKQELFRQTEKIAAAKLKSLDDLSLNQSKSIETTIGDKRKHQEEKKQSKYTENTMTFNTSLKTPHTGKPIKRKSKLSDVSTNTKAKRKHRANMTPDKK